MLIKWITRVIHRALNAGVSILYENMQRLLWETRLCLNEPGLITVALRYFAHFLVPINTVPDFIFEIKMVSTSYIWTVQKAQEAK